MPRGFVNLRTHVDDEGTAAPIRGLGAPRRAVRSAAVSREVPEFTDDEDAARFYLSEALGRDPRPGLRSITAPDRPEVVPELQLHEVRAGHPRALRSAAGGKRQRGSSRVARVLSFQQTREDIPIFGSKATVELGPKRELVAIDATLAEITDVPRGIVGEDRAFRTVAAAAGVPDEALSQVASPVKMLFYDESGDRWRLVWFFRRVPTVAPAGPQPISRGHGLGRSPRDLQPRFNYLVDAQSGEIVLQYPADPMVVRCRGKDEDGVEQVFLGSANGSLFEMYDSLRSIRTFDLNGGDIEGPFPSSAVSSPTASGWQQSAAVSAHVSAQRVQLFLSDVLGRHSIDGKGMEIVSAVNCTYSEHQQPPEWFNAVWYDSRMWYGQARDEQGRLRSYARYLDVIAHELTHGITERTADLIYLDLSGALNESFSDIFGIIVKNWYLHGADSDVAQWEWELGRGLGGNGLPLRDFSNPSRTNDPVHMNQYVKISSDNGGVHTYSNIHNLAAYKLLVPDHPEATPPLSPRDVAVLYFMTLQRLGSSADFSDARQTLLNVARTYFGDPGEKQAAIRTIEAAYDAVGIV